MRLLYKIVIFCFVLPYTNLSFGHGDLHAKIQKVSKEIKSHPDSAYLYLKRGKLYYQHEEPEKSLKDYKQCESLGYTSVELDYCFSSAYEASGNFGDALVYVDKILGADTTHVNAHRLKGEILMQTLNYKEAAAELDKVLLYAQHPITENYLESSKAWEKYGGPQGSKRAVEVIETGIGALGNLFVFLERLVELHCQYKNYTTAIDYQNQIIDHSARKENAYYKRARIYLEKGDFISAKLDLEKVLVSIHELPPRIKRNKAMQDLNHATRDLLKSLK